MGCVWVRVLCFRVLVPVGSWVGFFVCSLRVWVGVLWSCRLWLLWVDFGGLISFFFWAVFFISSFAFSLVYCRCTKGRLALLIKSVYYL